MKQIFFLLPLLLFGNLSPFLKKAEGKSEGHSIRNIDFIYMLNLDERPEKWNASINQLALYGISPYRFSAVNGWKLPFETIDQVGVKLAPKMKKGFWGTVYRLKGENGAEDPSQEGYCRSMRPFDGSFVWHQEKIGQIGQTYFSHCLSRGAIGIVLSHLSILQDAYDSGYETIWVMEDDIAVLQDPRTLSDSIEQLDALIGKEGWDILFTDPDSKNNEGIAVPCYSYAQRPNFTPANPYHFLEREEISSHFRKIGARYGAYSMIIRRSGMKKIIDFLNEYHVFLPYDMEYTLPPKIKLYTLLQEVVSTQPGSPSDNV